MNKVDSGAINSNLHGLITHERAEKFELLAQRILNHKEVIVLCGVEGIGKSTLLEHFEKNKANIWAICLLQGLGSLGFEEIQNQLEATIRQYYPKMAGHDLQSALIICEHQRQKVVLMIDDANKLAAGLVASLIEYASHHLALSVVFALTREQLYLKNITDRAIEGCYFIEIPALTESQMIVFLQNVSLFPNLENNEQQANVKWLDKLYQRTLGVPGKIILDFPLLVNDKGRTFLNPLKLLLFISLFFVSAALFHVAYLSHDKHSENSQPAALRSVASKPAKLAMKQDVITLKPSR